MKTGVMIVVALCATVVHSQSLREGNFGAARNGSPTVTTVTAPEAKKAAPKQKPKSYPFHGELDSIAANGSSITLRGKARKRVLVISENTRVYRDGARTLLKDGQPGERVTGSVFRNPEGKEEALTVRFGAKQQ